ncbi:hypothetical protein J2Z62_000221 [Mycoplasmoides fastidiosum]|uniref:Uncharacterized protein n=1 Tax=Mycoplasmoides fastidiosum TaxID=92758 RepID=A0ABU0LYL6_9BACT|nr:hypothetical protein [Mycoplasmoides fastidiosum]
MDAKLKITKADIKDAMDRLMQEDDWKNFVITLQKLEKM